jgi:hypothetical protein
MDQRLRLGPNGGLSERRAADRGGRRSRKEMTAFHSGRSPTHEWSIELMFQQTIHGQVNGGGYP